MFGNGAAASSIINRVMMMIIIIIIIILTNLQYYIGILITLQFLNTITYCTKSILLYACKHHSIIEIGFDIHMPTLL